MQRNATEPGRDPGHLAGRQEWLAPFNAGGGGRLLVASWGIFV